MIHECLKVLFDIALEFIENQEMIDASLWKTLEKQLDCLVNLNKNYIINIFNQKIIFKE